jgi:hypothetical protein
MNHDIDVIRKLQTRINEALTEQPEAQRASNYSDYLPDHSPQLLTRLMTVAQQGGIAGVEAALDEFDHLKASEDLVRMQKVLIKFLTHHPAPALLGLSIPTLSERANWKTLPSKRSL